jgi:hypothetical protein
MPTGLEPDDDGTRVANRRQWSMLSMGFIDGAKGAWPPKRLALWAACMFLLAIGSAVAAGLIAHGLVPEMLPCQDFNLATAPHCRAPSQRTASIVAVCVGAAFAAALMLAAANTGRGSICASRSVV